MLYLRIQPKRDREGYEDKGWILHAFAHRTQSLELYQLSDLPQK